jgi:type I restriction enzyme S subunit
MDFSRERFIKDLLTTASIKVSFISKHPLIKLSELVETIGGLWTGEKAPFVNAKVVRSTNFTNDCLFNDTDIIEIEVEQSKFEKRQLKKGDIIIEKSGGSAKQAVGRVIFFDKDEDGFSFSNFTNRLRVTSDKIIPEYLYIILSKIYMDGYTFGYQTGASNLKNLNIDKYLSIKVPVPENKEVQKSIVDAYKKIDEEYLKSRLTIKEYSDKISHLFAKYDVAKWGGKTA